MTARLSPVADRLGFTTRKFDAWRSGGALAASYVPFGLGAVPIMLPLPKARVDAVAGVIAVGAVVRERVEADASTSVGDDRARGRA